MGILYSEPMCQAAYDDDIHKLRKLISANPKNKERTCLHYATRRTFSFLDYLMIAILMPILLIGYLIMVEKQRKNVKLMELLLATKVEVNAVDYKGNTGLHYACQRKSQSIIPLLLEKNADVSVQNKNHETPLDIAKRLQFHKIVSMLTKSM
ncbi:ankyrin repeat domain-containing protein 22 isoform X2 [Carassius gibelio]|uniref:ankyrin repeat domain-containing protein 22 isoform X2 n=1 Tax=Carassius gibelio TaxID=101364 RepID=UPI002279B1A5|nr:ankyrin repeat domain-containing protein 22 isoform X2 [Carassius gibelio]